jgi:DNA-binding CsgD family transcriptional regulator
MSLTLSSADLEQLETTLTTLLSPLSYPSLGEWRTASRRHVEALLRADRSFSMLPIEGEPLMECERDLLPAAAAYQAYFHRLDPGLHITRRELGLESFHCSDVYDMREHARTEKWNDWNRPHGLFDATLLTVDVGSALPPAIISIYHERESTPSFGERGRMLFRLLLPAFKASIHACRRLIHYRAQLGALLDDLPEGLAVFDLSAAPLHQNPALIRLLDEEPERERLLAEVRSILHALGALAHGRHASGDEQPLQPAWREVRTGRGRYRLRGNLMGDGILGPAPVILVSLERLTPRPITDETLQRQYGLTRREIDVARLLAQGRSNLEIAGELRISTHTARRHTEHVLAKLGVHTRAAVGAKLQAG